VLLLLLLPLLLLTFGVAAAYKYQRRCVDKYGLAPRIQGCMLLLLLLRVEIFKYQRHCVDKYGLAPHIRLSTRVTAAAFDAGSGSWSITTSAGDTLTARVLVLAQGARWCSLWVLFSITRFFQLHVFLARGGNLKRGSFVVSYRVLCVLCVCFELCCAVLSMSCSAFVSDGAAGDTVTARLCWCWHRVSAVHCLLLCCWPMRMLCCLGSSV
jgi:hypothetical protein